MTIMTFTRAFRSCLAALLVLAATIRASAETSLPTVVLFTTGGAIQGKGIDRQEIVDYSAGTVAPAELLADLPELKQLANIELRELANVGEGMNTAEELKLAREVNAALAKPNVSGAVVAHGTETLEETAYFLNLVVRSDKPVVVVGALRPFTAVSRDGPFNLYNAVRVARSPNAKGLGVLVMLNDEINAARDVTKANTNRLDAFTSRDLGPLGYADSDRVVFYRRPVRRHTVKSEFAVDDLRALPRVDVTYAYQDADATAIDAFVAAGAKGIVLAGAGPESIGRGQTGVVFVLSSRNGSGRVVEGAGSKGRRVLTTDNLTPQKARVLLRLALTKTNDLAELQRIFNEY